MAAFPTQLKLWETGRLSFVLAYNSCATIFNVTVISDLRERCFQLNHTSQFYETDFMRFHCI